jgi:hypothetical protein
MELVLIYHSSCREGSNDLFFEHVNSSSALSEIVHKVNQRLKDVPKVVSKVDMTYDGMFGDIFSGYKTFDFAGIQLYYADFITSIPLIPDSKYSVVVIEPIIITLHDYFARRRAGRKLSTIRHSILKYNCSK